MILLGESEKDLKLDPIWNRTVGKHRAKSKVMAISREEVQIEVVIDGESLEQVAEYSQCNKK